MSKDLFDESTMTFGEHLEVLRRHLWRAILGFVIATVIAFFISKEVLLMVQAPVTNAMYRYFNAEAIDKELLNQPSGWQKVVAWLRGAPQPAPKPAPVSVPTGTSTTSGTAPAITPVPTPSAAQQKAAGTTVDPLSTDHTLVVEVDAVQLMRRMHDAFPREYPALPADAKPLIVKMPLTRESQIQLETLINAQNAQVRTDTVDEAFMIYLKVSLIVGFMMASPYIFYEIWQFVAAGLYPHERKYVYVYLPMSLGLFLGGCLFCFFAVIPFVLDFLFGFNRWLGLRPEMKISSWLTFVTILPLAFGISFQLPLVMLFLEKINIFTVQIYRTYRRHSIFVIAILSMILTPSDPVSMLLMMVPLVILYELGILLCARNTSKSPFPQPA